MVSEDSVAGFFTCKVFLLLVSSLARGASVESISTSDSSLESESSLVDSSSLSASSEEERVLLESRWESFKFATCGTAFEEVLSSSSLLLVSSESR